MLRIAKRFQIDVRRSRATSDFADLLHQGKQSGDNALRVAERLRINVRCFRAAILLPAACCLIVLAATHLSAEPAKKSPSRRGYDFSRPGPREILPNPKEGVGVPPRLRTYVTVKEMASTESTAKTRPPERPDPGPSDAKPVSSETRETQANLSPAAGAPSAPAPEQDDWRLSQTARVSRHVENILAGQIGDRGIDGSFQFEPSAAAQRDPTLLAAEKRTWDRVVRSLELSRAAWQTAHAMALTGEKPLLAATSLPPPRGVQPAVQTAPGLILLRGAPPSVIGDIADVAP